MKKLENKHKLFSENRKENNRNSNQTKDTEIEMANLLRSKKTPNENDLLNLAPNSSGLVNKVYSTVYRILFIKMIKKIYSHML